MDIYKKKYKEALERARVWKEKSGMPADKQGILDDIFPELAGSEDERIRKELLEHCINRRDGKQVCVDASDYRRWADWLEKQGEQKPADTVELKCEESKTKVFDAPTPFEDKLYAFVLACEILVDPSKREFILEHSQEILDAAREQIGKEQSSTWCEEDELVVEDIEEAVINYWHGQSQEDLLDWLKSLKTRYTWKPSDEQLEIIDMLFTNETLDDNVARVLRELEEQLKKLREE